MNPIEKLEEELDRICTEHVNTGEYKIMVKQAFARLLREPELVEEYKKDQVCYLTKGQFKT